MPSCKHRHGGNKVSGTSSRFGYTFSFFRISLVYLIASSEGEIQQDKRIKLDYGVERWSSDNGVRTRTVLRVIHAPGYPLITSSKGRDGSLPSEPVQKGFRH